MIEVGRVCVKIAGRDAGKKCVIVDILDDTYVLIDGETRRRKCNFFHLEPLNEVVKLSKGAGHDEVKKAVDGIMTIRDTKAKKTADRPRKVRKQKEAKTETKKPAKVKKEEPAPKKKEEQPKAEESKEQ